MFYFTGLNSIVGSTTDSFLVNGATAILRGLISGRSCKLYAQIMFRTSCINLLLKIKTWEPKLCLQQLITVWRLSIEPTYKRWHTYKRWREQHLPTYIASLIKQKKVLIKTPSTSMNRNESNFFYPARMSFRSCWSDGVRQIGWNFPFDKIIVYSRVIFIQVQVDKFPPFKLIGLYDLFYIKLHNFGWLVLLGQFWDNFL